MEMDVLYESIGCLDEAITLLSFVDTYPIALYQKAYIYHLKGDEKGAMVFLDEANKKLNAVNEEIDGIKKKESALMEKDRK